MVVIIMSTEPEELLPEHHPCGVLLQLLTLTLTPDTTSVPDPDQRTSLIGPIFVKNREADMLQTNEPD